MQRSICCVVIIDVDVVVDVDLNLGAENERHQILHFDGLIDFAATAMGMLERQGPK